MSGQDYKKRIDRILGQANSEPKAPDVLIQKLAQELGIMAERQAISDGKIEQLKQAQQKQSASLDSFSERQDQLARHVRCQAPAPSAESLKADIGEYFGDKFLEFKVQVGCALCVFGLVVAALFFWADSGHDTAAEPPKGALQYEF